MVAYSLHSKEHLKQLDETNPFKNKSAKLVANRRYLSNNNLKPVQLPIELYDILNSKKFGQTIRESATNIAQLLNATY